MYKVWSHHPPALWQSPRGLALASGTVYKIMHGDRTLPTNSTFPAGTTLKDFQWMKPVQPVALPKFRTVKGSKGTTYTIRTRPDGREECTCPGFTYRRTCKHVNLPRVRR